MLGEVVHNFGVCANHLKFSAFFNWYGQYSIDVVVIEYEEVMVAAVI